MPTDFPTALARLLRDGSLRDQLRKDPQGVVARLDLAEDDAGVIMALSPADLEYQAGILIRKRLDAIKGFLPMTLADLGSEAFSVFNQYARTVWPARDFQREFQDASAFADFLLEGRGLHRADECRMGFLRSSRRWAILTQSEAFVGGRRRRGIQIFCRNRRGALREWFVHFGF